MAKKVSLADKLKSSSRPVGIGDPPHVIVVARAGTGKTTTLIEGLKKVRGVSSTLIPSPQQAAVWDAMMLGPVPTTIGFCAFNKSIATELQKKVPPGCDAMTLHSLGFRAVNRAFRGLRVEEAKVPEIIAALKGKDIREMRKKEFTLLKATEELVRLCKMNLTGQSAANALETEELDKLARYYEVEMTDESSGKSYRSEVFDLVPEVLLACQDIQRFPCINFDDMVWLPVVLDLPIQRYDLLLVDEAQDLNRCQQALAKKAGKRLVLCGDPKQAIYGFAGADSESMKRMEKELDNVTVLPLTVTRRCGKAIVREAKKIVPDFDAFESNGEGKVSSAKYPHQKNSDGEFVELPWEQTYGPTVKPGDMCLCRTNAPLVSQCFSFIKRGIKANILGRDIAQGLISTIRKLMKFYKAGESPPEVAFLTGKVQDWVVAETEKEQAKRNPSESKIINLSDRADCILCFTEGETTVDGIIRRIETIFTDNRSEPGVRFSSIHKAKGLEAHRVFFLQPYSAPCPHPMAKSTWAKEQEYNLVYVATTRAIEELIIVS